MLSQYVFTCLGVQRHLDILGHLARVAELFLDMSEQSAALGTFMQFVAAHEVQESCVESTFRGGSDAHSSR